MASDTDRAFDVLLSMLPQLEAFASKPWSEADTRSKLIDPIFHDVLGWDESDIKREEPAAKGYADYLLVIGAYRHLHIEAKRSLPRWKLHASEDTYALRLSGPHLLGNKELKKHIQQAQSYGPSLGSSYALLTNGAQFILFRAFVQGDDWREYDALCWTSLNAVKQDFARFYALLSKPAVKAGSLTRALTPELVNPELYRPADFVTRADAEYVRNPFWAKISNTVGPLLSDNPSDTQLADLIIRHCYVATPMSDQADANISELLKDLPSPALKNAGVVDVKPGMGGNTAFGFRLADDIKAGARPGTYIITGGVGSGKTTFLRRYASVVAPDFVKKNCVWVSLDFLPVGAIAPGEQSATVTSFAFNKARERLQDSYSAYPRDGESIRALFQSEIKELRKTRLHGYSKDDSHARATVNELIDRLWTNDELVATRLLAEARKQDLRPVIVFDNTDQLGEPAQEAVFLLAQKVASETDALCIVALREEKFFAAYRRGVFDAYGDRRFHIGSPDLANVIRRRLQYARDEYERSSRASSTSERATAEQVLRVLDCLIRSTTSRNANIVRYLSCVSNGDMRLALSMFREFVSSGNTDTNKIQRTIAEYGGYTVPFHEFAKSAILGSRRYYQASTSHIVNVFRKSSAQAASHFTAIRLLARLSASQTSPSPHGDGYVETAVLVDEWTGTYGASEDLSARCEELIRRGLLESEPPRQPILSNVDALRISASGAYYWRYLVRSFAYLDLAYFDTPIADRDLARTLASMSSATEMQVRFERVRAFLEFLAREERNEVTRAAVAGASRASLLMPQVQEQIESEFEWIRRKLADPDLE